MKELLITLIGSGPVLYVLARVYAALRGKDISGQLDYEDVKSNVRRSNGFWEWLVPITVGFAFVYNVIATSVWFLGELISVGLTAISWLFANVFITGPWFLARMAWHYLVVWPWTILRMAFGEIRKSLTARQFLTAATGLFVCLLLFVISQWDEEWPEWLSYLLSTLSLFPIGWAAGKIAVQANGDEYTSATRNTYFKHLGILVILFVALTTIEALLFSLGTFSSLSTALSQLFVFGSLFSSALLLLNAIALIFAISALPSFSASYSGTDRNMLWDFWKHLRGNGLKYILAVPSASIPMALLAIAPTFLVGGIVHITHTIGNEVYSERIESFDTNLPEAINLYDLSISDDSVAAYYDALKASSEIIVAKRSVENDHEYMTSILEPRSDETAALPYYTLFVAIDSVRETQSQITQMSSTSLELNDLIDNGTSALENAQSETERATSLVSSAEAAVERAKENRDLICYPADGEESDVKNKVADEEALDEASTDEGPTPCDIANARVQQAENAARDARAMKARAELVENQATEFATHVASLDDNNAVNSKLAWLLASILVSLLYALTCALPFVLFARLNGSIASEGDDGKVVVLEEIATMNAANKNQPLLGLGLTLLFIMSITGMTVLNIQAPSLPSAIANPIENVFGELDELIDLDSSSEVSLEEATEEAVAPIEEEWGEEWDEDYEEDWEE